MKHLMIIVLLLLARARNVSYAEEEAEKIVPHPLAQAGCEAVTTGNIHLMKALLQAGLPINEPLYVDAKVKAEDSPNWTALHLCCIHNQPAMMKFLLKRGARRDERDGFNKRPIDRAVETGNDSLCKLLAMPEVKEDTIAGLPEGLIRELMDPRMLKYDDIVFVSLNKKDPPKESMNIFRRFGEKLDLVSNMELISEAEGYHHKKSKEKGHLVEIYVSPAKSNDPFAQRYEWSVRITSAPHLSGGGVKGIIQKMHGYWVITEQSSWDE